MRGARPAPLPVTTRTDRTDQHMTIVAPTRRGARPRAAAVAGIVIAGVAWQYAPARGATAAPRTWYVDCAAATAGGGTSARPLNALAAASAQPLHPGDRMLLRRGSVCHGTLAPSGSGTPSQPIVIGAYGTSTAARPRIDGGGSSAAVVLADESNVTLDGLEITNSGSSAGAHRGVYFTSEREPVTGLTLQNLLIHDVDGTSSTKGKNGGAIVGWALTAKARFDNVVIQDNTIHDVSRQGITVYGTTAGSRPPTTRTWRRATTSLVVRGNTVQRVQGDGIVVLGTAGALIEHNVVTQGNLAGYDYRSKQRDCSAGIWAWNANATLIQYNEVSDMYYGPSTAPGALNGCDGEAFDVDYNQDGTVVQYNYSHDNDGGFVLLCTADGAKVQRPHHADVRYNLSVGDNATFSIAACSSQYHPAVNTLDGVRMFNNTIVAATPRVTVQLDESQVPAFLPFYGGFVFENNLVAATGPGAAAHRLDCGESCTNDMFWRIPPPATATNPVTKSPQFFKPAARGSGFGVAAGFKLRAGSRAIGGGAVVPPGVPQPATENFFGLPITNPPSIGFS